MTVTFHNIIIMIDDAARRVCTYLRRTVGCTVLRRSAGTVGIRIDTIDVSKQLSNDIRLINC